MTRASMVALAMILAVAGFVVYASMGQDKLTCEVCVTHKGRSKCRKAAGPTRDQTVEAAQDNACAFLATGMTQNIQCGQIRPDRVTCD